jgi:hypothetical protein
MTPLEYPQLQHDDVSLPRRGRGRPAALFLTAHGRQIQAATVLFAGQNILLADSLCSRDRVFNYDSKHQDWLCYSPSWQIQV